RLQRPACQLSDKENFDHAKSIVPSAIDRAAIPPENAAPVASAMQFIGRFCDRAPLIARTGELVLAGLAAAVAAGDRGGAVGRTAGDFVELHLAGKAVVQ